MLQGTSDWTVVVSAVASVVSTVVALISTIIAARTYRQSREDKETEIEYKRPKFKLIRAFLQLINHINDEYSINPFYDLTVTFQNTHSHPATKVRVEGKIFQESGKKLAEFVKEPIEEIDERDTVEVIQRINIKDIIDTVNYLRLSVTYFDGRTHREYSQSIYRKFYGPTKDFEVDTIDLIELDRSEWSDYVKTHRIVIEAQMAENEKKREKFIEKWGDPRNATLESIIKSKNKNDE